MFLWVCSKKLIIEDFKISLCQAHQFRTSLMVVDSGYAFVNYSP